MLVTLKVSLADGTERLLAAEVNDPPQTAEALLREHFVRGGQLVVGDREAVSLQAVVRVEFASPEQQRGPEWLGRLRDEDVESAMEGRFERPSHEEAP